MLKIDNDIVNFEKNAYIGTFRKIYSKIHPCQSLSFFISENLQLIIWVRASLLIITA